MIEPSDASSLLRWYELAASFDPRLKRSNLFREPTRPLRYARRALRGNRHYGSLISDHADTHRGSFLGYWRLFRSFGHSIEEYYRYRLHDLDKHVQAGAFLPERGLWTTCGNGYGFLRTDVSALLDKVRFALICSEHRLPAIPTVAGIEHGRVVWGDGAGDRGLPEADLITKPKGRKWQPIRLWRWESGGHVDQSGNRFSPDSLIDRLCEESRNGPMMIQRRVRNPRSLFDLAGGGLCTYRVVTSRPRDGDPEVQVAVLKMPIRSSCVDNFALGGIAAPVDLGSGHLGAAVSKSVEGMVLGESFAAHPDTGRPIAGESPTDLDRVLELCVAAHRRFPEFHSIGWDVAPTDDGPVLVEGNHDWDPVVAQQPGLVPLGATALVSHVTSFFAERSEDSPGR